MKFEYAFSSRLYELLEEREVTQLQLAKAVGISGPTVSCYVYGRAVPSVRTLIKIADYFDVSTDYLTGRIDIKNPNWRSNER